MDAITDGRFPVRLVTVHGLRLPAGSTPADATPAAGVFDPSSGIRRHYDLIAHQAPYRRARLETPPGDISWIPPAKGHDPVRTCVVQAVSAELWGVPYATHCVVVEVCARTTPAELRDLMADTFWRYRRMRLGPRDAITWAAEVLAVDAATVAHESAYQLVVVPKGEAPFTTGARATRGCSVVEALEAEFDLPELLHMLSRNDVPVRPGLGETTVFLASSNKTEGSICAVRESIALKTEWSAEGTTATILSVVQVVAAAGRLRQIRSDAFETLKLAEAGSRIHGDGSGVPGVSHGVGALAERVGELHLGLAYGVEANLDAARFLPVGGIADIHRAIADSMWLPEGVAQTSDMLNRLTAVLTAREAAAREEERGREEAAREAAAKRDQALQNVLAVLGALFLTPSLVVAVYGTNFSTVPSLGSGRELLALLLLMIASAIGTWLVLKLIRAMTLYRAAPRPADGAGGVTTASRRGGRRR